MKARIDLSIIAIMLTISIYAHTPVKNGPEDIFDQFITAQNQHDLALLDDLLLDSKDFLWVTKGIAIWGKDEALKRFKYLYKGTWTLDPEMLSFKMIKLDKNCRQIHVLIDFSIGEPGREPKQIKFLMNMVLVKKSDSWKVASILPIQTAN